jgi:predicted transcriptional regulator
MPRNEAFATKIPGELKRALDEVCRKHGLRKSFVVESALREKIEDLLDTYDLKEAIAEGDSFRPWNEVKKELVKKGRA